MKEDSDLKLTFAKLFACVGKLPVESFVPPIQPQSRRLLSIVNIIFRGIFCFYSRRSYHPTGKVLPHSNVLHFVSHPEEKWPILFSKKKLAEKTYFFQPVCFCSNVKKILPCFSSKTLKSRIKIIRSRILASRSRRHKFWFLLWMMFSNNWHNSKDFEFQGTGGFNVFILLLSRKQILDEPFQISIELRITCHWWHTAEVVKSGNEASNSLLSKQHWKPPQLL